MTRIVLDRLSKLNRLISIVEFLFLRVRPINLPYQKMVFDINVVSWKNPFGSVNFEGDG